MIPFLGQIMAECTDAVAIEAGRITAAESGGVAITASCEVLGQSNRLPWTAIAAVALAGTVSFMNLWATQPLLPLLSQIFSAPKSAVGMTVSATTIAIALSAPFYGVLAEHIGRKRVIVIATFLLVLPVLLAATARSLNLLILWRFLQGVVTPGIFGITVATITEEWPREDAPKVMSTYLCGCVIGGFAGRVFSGYAATHRLFPGVAPTWHVGFIVLGIFALVSGAILARWLPKDSKVESPIPGAVPSSNLFRHLRNPQLAATYLVGFNILFSLVAIFTYINFHLASPPYFLNPSQLSWVFSVYLVGLVVTPLAGVWIAKVGSRKALMAAEFIAMSGVLLTLLHPLPMILLGLTLCSSAVFACQVAASSYIQVAAPAGERSSATGLYVASYYIGGSVSGVLPGYLWHFGGWTVCVVLVLVVQALTIVTAGFAWKPEEKLVSPVTEVLLPNG
jgi:predicted MFS family arabinose efflux permease